MWKQCTIPDWRIGATDVLAILHSYGYGTPQRNIWFKVKYVVILGRGEEPRIIGELDIPTIIDGELIRSVYSAALFIGSGKSTTGVTTSTSGAWMVASRVVKAHGKVDGFILGSASGYTYPSGIVSVG